MALDRLTKVDGGGISTTSDYRVGVITASKFVGPLDGTVGNFSGIITASGANFSGNVTIGGTLTYEDVTNIDSVGIITARDGLKVLAGGANVVGVGTFGSLDIGGDIDVDGHTNLDNVSIAGVTTFASHAYFGDNDKLYFGASAGMDIFQTGAYGYIRHNGLVINSNDLIINATNSHNLARFSYNSDVELYYANSKKFATTNTGINVTGNVVSTGADINGDLDVDGHTNLDNVSIAGVTTFTGITTAGILYATDFKAPDGNTNGFYAGNSDDLHLFHNGADSYIENDTGNLTFTNKNSNNIIFKTTSSEVEKVRITSDGNVGINTSSVSIAGMSRYLSISARNVTNGGSALELVGARTGTDQSLGVINFVNQNSNVAEIRAKYQGSTTLGSLHFSTSGSEKLQITSTGHLGVGDNNPDTRLSVTAASGTDVVGKFTSTDANAWIQFRDNSTTDTAVMVGASGDNLLLRAGSNTRVHISSAGDVGIGYNSPTVKLHIREAASGYSGTYDNRYHCIIEDDAEAYYGIYVPDNGYGGLRFHRASGGSSATSAVGYIDCYMSNEELHYYVRGSGTSGKHIFSTAGLNRLKIDENGHLTIGTAAAAGGKLYFESTSGAAQYIASGGTNNQDLIVGSSAGEKLRITSAGTVHTKMTGTLPTWLGDTIATREKFSVFQGANFAEACFNIDVDNANSFLSHNMYYSSGWRIKKTGQPVRHLEIGTNGWRFMTGADGADDAISALTERLRITSAGNLTVTGSTANLFTSNSYNILELRADENNDGGNDDIIFKFTHDGTFRSEMRYDESESRLEISTSDNRNDLSMDTDGKVTFAKDIATAQDYPNLKPTLDLNFAGTASLDPRITFTRQGSGSYYGRDGLLKFAAQNEPRFDYDPITRECKGLLIEEQRQNWAFNSYRASNDDGATNYDHGYNMINGAVTINDFGTAPDGTNTATKMYPASSGSARGIELIMSLTGTGNWTNSIYVKAAGHTGWIALYGVNGGARAYFNPSTGAKGSSGGTGAPSSGQYGIQDVGNGWYRIHLTVNLSSTGGAEYHYIYFGDSDNSTTVTASGTNGILMWGLQVEKGDFPTSYIRQDSNNRQYRAADECYIDGQDFLDFYNQTEGTMISSHSILSDEISSSHNLYTYQIAPLANTAHAPFRVLDRNSSIANSIAVASVYNNGYSFLSLDTGNPVTVAGRKYVIALSVKKDDYDAVFDGGDLLTDSSGDLFTADHISIGYYKPSPQAYLNGHIQRLTYYPLKLTDNQLKTVTS